MWGEEWRRGRRILRHGIDDIYIAGGSGSGKAGRGIAYIAISWPIFCCWWGRGRGVGRSKYSYSTVSCSVSVYYTCLYDQTRPSSQKSLLFVYTCLLGSVAVPLRFVHRSGSVTVVICYFQFPVPWSWTGTFPHSVPGRYRPSWVYLLRFCEFRGFQSIFFKCFLFRWTVDLDSVFVVWFFLCFAELRVGCHRGWTV